MKKTILYLMTTCLTLTFTTNELKAKSDLIKTEKPIEKSDETQKLINRLEEIKSMDKSTMKWTEKRALRKEVQAIDKKLHPIHGGVYVSVGGLLLVIILLIILF